MKNVRLLGIPITMTSTQEILDKISDVIQSQKKLSIVAINARKIIRALDDEKMKKTIESFDIYIADGKSVVNAVDKNMERITGIDLMMNICKHCSSIQGRIFMYGSTLENNEKARQKLIEMYPNIHIVGQCDGYHDENVVAMINHSQANIVFIAKGTPQQEKWIETYKNHVDAHIFLGVGGAFDVLSGQVSRAPQWIQKIGFEWLYRMFLEPSRFQQIPELWRFRKLIKKQNKVSE